MESNINTHTKVDLDKLVLDSIHNTPEFSQEVAVTEKSYPLSSYACLRERNSKEKKIPYNDWTLVRKPKAENFRRQNFIDIYNPSNGYEYEDVWCRSHPYYLENNHIYISVTLTPINVNCKDSRRINGGML